MGTPQDQPPPLLPKPWPCLSGWLRTASKDGVPVEEYRYNANESRIYEMNAQRRISGPDLTYSDEDHLLTVGGIVYAYDRDGFLQSRTDGSETTAYDYSSRGELLSVTLPDGTVISYLHDPLGRRITKKVNGATVETYLWAGRTRLLAVYDGSGNLKMRFEYADGMKFRNYLTTRARDLAADLEMIAAWQGLRGR